MHNSFGKKNCTIIEKKKMKNEKNHKTQKTSSIVFVAFICFMFMVASINVVLIQTSAVEVRPSEPFTFDVLPFYRALVYDSNNAITVYDKASDLISYQTSDDVYPLKVVFNADRGGINRGLAFNEEVYFDRITASLRLDEVTGRGTLTAHASYRKGLAESWIAKEATITRQGDVYLLDMPIGVYTSYIIVEVEIDFDGYTYEGFTLQTFNIDIAGGASENVSMQVTESEAYQTTPETSEQPFVPPELTIPDFSAITEAPSPVDSWLEPAHGGAGGVFDPTKDVFGNQKYKDAAAWLTAVITFIVTEPLVSVPFALGCAFMVARVAFGGK